MDSEADYTFFEIPDGPLLIFDDEDFEAGGFATLTKWELAVGLSIMFSASLAILLCLYFFWKVLGI